MEGEREEGEEDEDDDGDAVSPPPPRLPSFPSRDPKPFFSSTGFEKRKHNLENKSVWKNVNNRGHFEKKDFVETRTRMRAAERERGKGGRRGERAFGRWEEEGEEEEESGRESHLGEGKEEEEKGSERETVAERRGGRRRGEGIDRTKDAFLRLRLLRPPFLSILLLPPVHYWERWEEGGAKKGGYPRGRLRRKVPKGKRRGREREIKCRHPPESNNVSKTIQIGRPKAKHSNKK